MKKSPVVNFIVIGAMKAGSTTLIDYLSQNKELCISKPKEPQYFSRHYGKWDNEFYESLWESPEKTCGEGSTCYSRWPYYKNVPERIYKYNSDIKLIYILRNPIDRAYSHYRHNILVDRLGYSSFNDALKKSEEIIMSSCYMKQLNEYMKFFSREQILLVDFDEMVTNDVQTINEIESFLNVKNTSKENLKEVYSNKAGVAATKSFARNKIDTVRHFPFVKQIIELVFSKEKRQSIRKQTDRFLDNSSLLKIIAKNKVNSIDPLTSEYIEMISNEIESDISELEDFWGRDLSAWKYLRSKE